MFCSAALVQIVSSAPSREELIKMHSPWWKSQGLGIPNLLLIQSSNFMWYGQAVIEVLRAVIFKVEQQHMHTVNSRCLIWKSNAYNPIRRRGKEPQVKLNRLPCWFKPEKTSLSRAEYFAWYFHQESQASNQYFCTIINTRAAATCRMETCCATSHISDLVFMKSLIEEGRYGGNISWSAGQVKYHKQRGKPITAPLIN